MRSWAVALALLGLGCTDHPPLEVAKVDLRRFQGGWYEIAKLPRASQAGCTATTASYRLKSPTELDVYSECREGSFDGPVRFMAARAVVTDASEPAKLSLDFGAFFGDYWILEVSEDYSRAAVGHPSRDYLWILSRTPTMKESDYLSLVERVREKDFDVSRLERTPQADDGEVTPPRPAELPSPSDHGCSLGRAPAASMSERFWLALVALVSLRARFARRVASAPSSNGRRDVTRPG